MSRFATAIVLLSFFLGRSVANQSDSDGVRDFAKSFFAKTGKINEYSKSNRRESEFLALARDNIDTEWVANFVLGKHKKSLDAEQKTQFIEVYSNYLATSYKSILGIYSESNYEILSVLEQQKGKVFMVNTLLSFNGKKVRNSFRIIKRDGKYYITDLVTEGISFISAKRAEIDAAFASKGFENFLRDLKLSLDTNNKK